MAKDLAQIYWDAHGTQGIDVEEFLKEVKQGRYGTFTAEEIRDFLIRLEASIIENIEMKATEVPQFALGKEQLIEETTERFALLRERYAR